jgi:polysaccharide deacetylase family protein (PEP-CTERM system associated)
MNILTFDIEDWYNVDFITEDFNWDKYEVRIYTGVDRILERLEKDNIKASFFCLGWLAEKHPDVIKRIDSMGHHIGCHSYQHQLTFRFTPEEFRSDTDKAKKLIEDVIGKEVNAFRAPGFSITRNNLWALDVLIQLGFTYDCSLFPADHDYGGYPDYGVVGPATLQLPSGTIKEFPINFHQLLGKNIVFSGGGFFRLFPYWLIKKWSKESPYLMTYFHPRDFDPEQPVFESQKGVRKFKSYVGLKHSFTKFDRYLNDFEFVNIEKADTQINWNNTNKLLIAIE